MISKRHLRSLAVRAPGLQNLRTGVQRAILNAAGRPFEPEFALLRHLDLGPGECLVDVGGNRGQSIDAIRLFHPAAPVVSFEPNPDLAAALGRRYRSDRHLRVVACGLAEEARAATLYIPCYAGYAFDGLASLDRDEAAGWLNSRTLAGFSPVKLSLAERTASLQPLDEFGLRPAFIKIDVQGGERAVLAGGRETIAGARPALLVETGRDEDLVAGISALGYAAYNYLAGRLIRRGPALRNTVFVNPKAMRGLDRLIDV